MTNPNPDNILPVTSTNWPGIRLADIPGLPPAQTIDMVSQMSHLDRYMPIDFEDMVHELQMHSVSAQVFAATHARAATQLANAQRRKQDLKDLRDEQLRQLKMEISAREAEIDVAARSTWYKDSGLPKPTSDSIKALQDTDPELQRLHREESDNQFRQHARDTEIVIIQANEALIYADHMNRYFHERRGLLERLAGLMAVAEGQTGR